MTIAPDAEQMRADAEQQTDSIVELARALVRIPSRGGLDDYGPVVQELTHWLDDRGLDLQVLPGPVAVVCDLVGDRPGPHFVLDACLDTADIGDAEAWSRDPYSGEVVDGWLHGRGSSDSKTGIAIFAHLMAALATHRDFAGRLTLLCDLDEHSGGFAGIRSYLSGLDRQPDGVMIGYPGNERIIVGGRGFYRARVAVHGHAQHSASAKQKTCNALSRAAELIRWLDSALPADVDPDLGLPSKLTVTSIKGGTSGSYSVVPDLCELEVDVRLTLSFTARAASELLREGLKTLDRTSPAPRRSRYEQATESWPPFRLPDDHPLPNAIRAGAAAAGLRPEFAVAGPSNIGCLLGARGIPATAGFGVRYRGLHGADEAIEVASIPQVYAAYWGAVQRLLA